MAYSSTQVLAKIIEEVVPDLRMQKAPLLDYLAAAGCTRKGDHTDLVWNAIVSGSATATAAMSVAGTDQNTGDSVQASLGFGAYKVYHQFSISRVDLVNARTAGVGRLKRLFTENIKGGMIAMRRQLNQYLWTAQGTPADGGIIGITKVMDTAAPNTYANISGVTYPLWTPIVQTAGTPRALTRDILYSFSTKLDEEETFNDALFCTPKMAQTYNTLFDTVAGINSVAGFGQTTDLGYASRSYNGAPLITDNMMPAGSMIGFNTQDLELLSMDLSDADGGLLASMGLKDNISEITSAEVGGMVINVALLPQSNPGLISFQLFMLPQLKVCNRRSVQGLLNLIQ